MEIRKHYGPLGIIALPGCEKLAKQVNAYLVAWRANRSSDQAGYIEDSYMIDVDIPRYPSGEAKAALKQTVRGYDLYIMADVTNYSVSYTMNNMENPMSPDEHFQNVKRVIAACTGKPARINVVMPFLYESRQHRRTGRESLDCAMALHELINMGVSNILTFDAHDPRVTNAIPLGGFENIMPTYQMLKALCKNVKDLRLDKANTMFVSPDEGAMQRNIYYASVLSLDLGMSYKRRDYSTIINGRNPIVAHEYLGASVEGKDVLVVDDMISSGESVIDLAKELKSRGANRIIVLATFAFFTNGIEAFNEAFRDGIIYRVVSTNATYRRPELLAAEWYIDADLSKYISYLIATLNHDRSLNDLLQPLKRIQNLVAKYKEEQTKNGIRFV